MKHTFPPQHTAVSTTCNKNSIINLLLCFSLMKMVGFLNIFLQWIKRILKWTEKNLTFDSKIVIFKLWQRNSTMINITLWKNGFCLAYNFHLWEEIVGKYGLEMWSGLQCFLWLILIKSMFKTCHFSARCISYIYKDFHLTKSD